jgi:putative lipoprotein (rSAM/lipoprotein system)
MQKPCNSPSVRRTFWRFVISFFGFFFGFTTSVAAQYGVIEAVYKVKGKVSSQECMVPVDKIRVTLSEQRAGNGAGFRSHVAETDEHGEFTFFLYGHRERESLQLHLHDPDGALNGHYKDTVLVIPAGRKYFGEAEQGHWSALYEYGEPLHIPLKALGVPPCAENSPQDQTEPQKPLESIEPELFPKADGADSSEMIFQEQSLTDGGPDIIVFPNPVSALLNIQITSVRESENAVLKVFDGRSRVVRNMVVRIEPGENMFTISTLHLPAGTYHLILQGKTMHHTEKIICL